MTVYYKNEIVYCGLINGKSGGEKSFILAVRDNVSILTAKQRCSPKNSHLPPRTSWLLSKRKCYLPYAISRHSNVHNKKLGPKSVLDLRLKAWTTVSAEIALLK